MSNDKNDAPLNLVASGDRTHEDQILKTRSSAPNNRQITHISENGFPTAAPAGVHVKWDDDGFRARLSVNIRARHIEAFVKDAAGKLRSYPLPQEVVLRATGTDAVEDLLDGLRKATEGRNGGSKS